MARPDKIEVTLSREDRQLLRDIRDALRAMGVEPDDEAAAADNVRRLVEDAREVAARSPSLAEMQLAARVRIKADKKRGVKTPDWIVDLAKG